MKTKSCSLPNWARCLCIACMIAVLAPPVAAQAPTIEWIKIYLNPMFHANHGFTYTRNLGGFGEYVHIDSNGAPIGATEVTQATQTARWGDVIAIAIRLKDVNFVNATLQPLSGWTTEGTGSSIKTARLKPNRSLESAKDIAVAADQDFTVVYLYTVREGDSDTNGGWFTDTSPFIQYSVTNSSGDKYAHDATNSADRLDQLTYSGNIVYPRVDGVPTVSAIKFYKNPTVWARYNTSPTDRQAIALKTADGPPTGIEITEQDAPFGVGDVIGIAVTLKNVKRAVPHLTLKFGEEGATLSNYNIRTRDAARQVQEGRAPTELWPGDGTNQESFVMYYGYRVQARDLDLDGGWFESDALGAIVPFSGNGGRIQGPQDQNYGAQTGQISLANIKMDASLVSSIVWPKIDGVGPRVESLAIAPPPAGQSGKSRYHEVRQTCLELHYKGRDDYTNACEYVDASGWSTVALDDVTYEAAYFKAGDEVAVTVTFNEAVQVSPDPDKQPTFYISGDEYKAKLEYKAGSGTDSLTFALRVTAGQHTFGGLQVWSNAFWRNTHDNFCRPRPGHTPIPLATDEVRWIKDLSGNDFGTCVGLETTWLAFVTNMPSLGSATHASPHPAYQDQNRPEAVAAYKKGIIRYLVDAIPATVWIPGVIKNGVTHRDDRRIAVVNMDVNYNAIPALTADDFRAPVTESDVQTGVFDVEFRFFNHPNAPADEVGESFTADDVDITGANVVREAWGVELTYIGLDHRSTRESLGNASLPGSAHVPGDAVNSAAFLVYKATITPALGFQGDVAISLPAGATQDIAGNGSMASNVLTVPVSNPLRVVEAPEIVAPPTGAYAAGQKIKVAMTYERENLRYLGENPPYLTIYLGDEVPANARHATWESAEDANSMKVTFAYTVAATDVAASVSVAPVGITVPTGTVLLDDSKQQLQGTSEPANEPGEGLETMPRQGQGQLRLGESDQGLAPRTDVPINLFLIFDETEQKSAATDVPRSPIVFNELGNGSGDTDDWLELRNVTGSAVSLKEWELSVVQDAKKEDTSLIVFPDVSVPANGLLLLTNSDADKTLLAAGDNIADAGKNGGLKHLYLVNAGLSLPDDGKFLLILRNAKEKLGLDEAFVDVAGGGGSDTDAFIREQTGLYDTYVWPLQVLQAPGEDTASALGSGKVWQRAKADIVGYHRDAWAEAAFTGLGYDRKVSKSAATAGTPGYPNVAPKAAAAKGSVTVSEIMVDSAGGTLPQWIELYNKSKTDAVNLNRWKLEIQNVDSEDLVGRPIVTLTLQEKVIQLNQTLLIVAGPARASSGAYLPPERVYDLLALHDKNLRIKRARDTFLSAEGIYLKLWDSTGTLVDEVGNTDGNRRTKDEPAWPLATSAEEGVRSSLIRRYTKGTSAAEDGTEKAGWVLAANVKQSIENELHWGSAEDIGTPGHRAGGALPVELSSFSVTRNEAGAVVVTWTTESEVDNAGFNLRRSEKRDSGFTLINPALIAGAGTTGERQTYTFTDTSAKPGVEYYYQIEEVAFDGKPQALAMRMLRGPVSASNRALLTFGELKQAK